MLVFDDVSVRFGEKVVFDKMGFGIAPGSLLHLKGFNGSGKSTLLKIASGLMEPSSGKVSWKGIDVFSGVEEYRRKFVAYVGHDLAIKNQLTVIENLAFWAELKDNRELLMPALSYFQLGDVADIPCARLSAGWRKRVALARLIIDNAKLWLLDEPDTNLDENARKLFLHLLTVKLSEGGMALIVSHSISNMPDTCILDMQDFTPSREFEEEYVG